MQGNIKMYQYYKYVNVIGVTPQYVRLPKHNIQKPFAEVPYNRRKDGNIIPVGKPRQLQSKDTAFGGISEVTT